MKKVMLSLLVVACLVATGGSVVGVVYAHRAASTGNAAPTSASGTTYALVIGMSDYAPCGAGGPDLQFADDDADDFESVLTGVYDISPTNITTLKDCNGPDAATNDNILNWFHNVASGVNDDIIVFVSGHGTQAFCPSVGRVGHAILVNDDADNDGDGDGLAVICDADLRTLVDGLAAARKVVILDISGSWKFQTEFRNATNTLFLAAGRGTVREAEFPVGDPCFPGQGIFTCWFVERGILDVQANHAALNPHTYNDPDVGGNEITFEEAYDYVFHQVPPIQKPGIVDNLTDDFLPIN
jgi:hypothetical protein